MSPIHAVARALLQVGLPLLLLNALLTLVNPGPTPLPVLNAQLSPELCVLLVCVAAWLGWRGRLPGGALRVLAWLTAGAVVLRGIEITSAALFGRSLHVYWDGRHVLGLLRMNETPWWWLVGGAGGALLAGLLLYAMARFCWRQIAVGLAHRGLRRTLGAAALLLLALRWWPTTEPATPLLRQAFAYPVAPVAWRQVRLLMAQWQADRTGSRLPASPAFDTNLAALHGADVLLVFAESYGVSTLDDPQQARQLAAPRAELARQLAAAGLGAVSARVRSPTFAGGSWLAHGSLLAGIDTRNPLDYDVLLTTQRPTLARYFSAHGYRSVAWMPGLQRPWPEGSFFGFDRIAGTDDVGYAGQPFGPWRVPDQASMAALDTQELTGAVPLPRKPRFVVFPTVSSHAPFRPVAPYVADWARLTGPEPYTAAERAHALDEPVSWRDPVPGYVQSVAYTWQWLGSYLATRAPRGLVTIMVGDHQAFAGVSGPGASWDVPVHVIASDAALLQRFEAAGFVAGLAPMQPALGAMHTLTPLLLSAFHAP